MELIIDIPEESYKLLQGNNGVDWLDAEHILTAVAEGTPLEQQPNRCRCEYCTHSEEQDGSNCYECVKDMSDNFEARMTNEMTAEEARRILLDIADQMPSDECADWIDAITLGIKAIDAQPKMGRWLAKSFHEVYCSNCEFDFDIMTNDFVDRMKYCPNCGAKMEVEE